MDFLVFPTKNDWKEDVFKLTPAGMITVAVLIALLVAVAILLRSKKEKSVAVATRQLVFSSVAMALGILTSKIKFANLPMGGSITLFSMFFIVLIGYWYGLKAGLLTGFAYGLLQFVLDPVFYSPAQLFIDYPLAFGSLGLSGLFAGKKFSLIKGYAIGVLGRYLFHFLSGMIFFGHYAPEGTPAAIHSLIYNATYIVPEAAVTILILLIPAVRKALDYVTTLAGSSEINTVPKKA